ncbi:hypothetical protein ANCCAN_15760 [Ancylostoma caninum]|uniref:Uncharacterized protein n=1 Tax=Ancylostoma caninum TaxID=29170 RepID=A0A368G3P6_ANCCA|nr:hypothetical protein ANCCAN_15760 [Ancylostoma caninum]
MHICVATLNPYANQFWVHRDRYKKLFQKKTNEDGKVYSPAPPITTTTTIEITYIPRRRCRPKNFTRLCK